MGAYGAWGVANAIGCVVAMEAALYGARLGWRRALALVAVCTGVGLASINDVEVSPRGAAASRARRRERSGCEQARQHGSVERVADGPRRRPPLRRVLCLLCAGA